FSFSGLKTAVLNSVNQTVTLTDQVKANIAKAFEEAVVETLVIKCKRALVQTGLTELVVAGGVAANRKLRENLEQELPSVFYAPPKLCTDNGSMIAFAGHERLMAGNREALAITTRPRWPLEDLGSI
ncbi:MAG: tRNA (adenosine(37)-N6)-threonylcarbamoyltransferase complex transferase subunit TsaD, partial [Gammaproteobacteria bacterium]|nr:tRNA (adenosine(37)-N6)-threonylcarbamoyltransferase complex transferase subunit TsaD [Gammaproteobacteria bacterium]